MPIDLIKCNQCGMYHEESGYFCQTCKDDRDLLQNNPNSGPVRCFNHNPLLGIQQENKTSTKRIKKD